MPVAVAAALLLLLLLPLIRVHQRCCRCSPHRRRSKTMHRHRTG
jgi:hypothetical protein